MTLAEQRYEALKPMKRGFLLSFLGSKEAVLKQIELLEGEEK